MMSDLLHVTDANYQAEVIDAKGVVVVDFWAPWCGPCRMLAPHLETVAKTYADDLRVVKYNVDESSDVAAQLGIRSIPTLIVYKDGQIVDQRMGAMSLSQLDEYLTQFI
ncbi:MAG: thioredoxin [Burkholderiaceae bacterium]|nr:thioredoxin [Burkholderiaceae bacterium]